MKLWEVQGSYWHAVEDHGKGGWRVNRRTFVVTGTAENAMRLWHASCQGPDSEIHQVICRTNHSTDLIVDQGPRES